MAFKNDTRTNSDQCQVVIFDWDVESSEDVSERELSQATAFDVSNYIDSVSISKSLANPAGQFNITLKNDRDWKDVISKGSWLIIYMDSEAQLAVPSRLDRNRVNLKRGHKVDAINISELKRQTDKIRLIGYVDTVRAQGVTGKERGDFDVNFVVSGRNYGVVYEETEIWHNQVLYDNTLLQTANAEINSNAIKTIDGLLKTLHTLFFAPDKLTKQPLKNGSLTSTARQWLLPTQLFSALDIQPDGTESFYGNIPNIFNFGPTPATYPVESPTALLNGVAWTRLKAHSIEPYHELYVELDDKGLPKLNFRLMPWVVDRTAVSKFSTIYANAGDSILFGADESQIVPINDLDIQEWDIGEDNHTRYNLFWSTLNSSLVSRQTSNTMIGDNDPKTGFPRILQNSVRRHGLRLLFSEVNANIIIGTEKADPDLVRQFNEFALEMWNRSHEYESGTMTIIGNNSIRLGKLIKTEEDSAYNSDKLFYIEGFEETFQVDDKGVGTWDQSLFLTRGIERSVLENSRLVASRQTPFADAGDFTEKD